MRPRTPLAILSFCALAALATLTIAPAPATAAINNSGTAGCAAPHPGDQVYWSNGSWCAVQEGAGGTAATGTAPGSPGIFYWAQSDAPKDLPSDCLHKNAGACMPTQRGGREVQEAKDGPIAGTRGGTGSKGAGKSETGRGKAKPKLTPEEECLELMRQGEIENPAALAVVQERLDSAWAELQTLRGRRAVLRKLLTEFPYPLHPSVAQEANRVDIRIGDVEYEYSSQSARKQRMQKARVEWTKKGCERILEWGPGDPVKK